MTSASAISRHITSRYGRRTRHLVNLLTATDGTVSAWVTNGSRWQTAALSRTRRLLLAKGYTVHVHRGSEDFLRPWNFILVIDKPTPGTPTMQPVKELTHA